jgi:hypothetical protein
LELAASIPPPFRFEEFEEFNTRVLLVVIASWFQESQEHFPVFATSMMMRRSSLGNGPSPKRGCGCFPAEEDVVVATVLLGITGGASASASASASLLLLFAAAAALKEEEDKDTIFVAVVVV